MTIQQHWDDRTPGYADSPRRWERPLLKSKIAVEFQGHRLQPHRIATDGQVFRVDAFLRDGRTLRLLLPPDYPCERLPVGPALGVRADLPELLGLPERDRSRAVTDADRVTLDLAHKARW